ncbi:MAG: hypothetical protein IVW57_14900, partial [Ktedonobacterales bacterium]|nr:hypothetical protein [Ktedonobacterales bacterium]
MRPEDQDTTNALPPLGSDSGEARPPAGGRPRSGGPPGLPPLGSDTDPFTTREMSPGLFPSYEVRRPPRPRPPRPSRAPWLIAVSVVALIAVVFGVLYTSSRVAPKSGIGRILGCGDGSPCQAADAYLKAYTSGNYEAMYGLTSSASRQHFSDPKILGGAYKDAHTYIVNRTRGILSAAQVY